VLVVRRGKILAMVGGYSARSHHASRDDPQLDSGWKYKICDEAIRNVLEEPGMTAGWTDASCFPSEIH